MIPDLEQLVLARLEMSTMLTLGGMAGFVVMAWSFAYWRAAVKTAFILVLLEGAIRK